MAKLTFLSVLKSNLKCAFCKNSNCPVRYFPDRKIVKYSNGSRYVTRCEKDLKRRENQIYRNKYK